MDHKNRAADPESGITRRIFFERFGLVGGTTLVMTAMLARDFGAKWPSVSGASAHLRRPASAERTAA